jgi:hypothetical protein
VGRVGLYVTLGIQLFLLIVGYGYAFSSMISEISGFPSNING